MCVQMYFKKQFVKYKVQILDLLSGEENLARHIGNLREKSNVPFQTNNDNVIFINTASY